jgi:hypothetical protein
MLPQRGGVGPLDQLLQELEELLERSNLQRGDLMQVVLGLTARPDWSPSED